MISRPIIIIGFLTLILVIAISIYFILPRKLEIPRDPALNEHRDINLNYRKPENWDRDDEAMTFAGMNVVGFKKPQSTARVAIGIATLEAGPPRPGELDTLIRQMRIGKMFTDLELDTKDGEWLGQPARRTVFRARAQNGKATVAGEGWACSHGDHIYLFLAWAQVQDLAAAQEGIDAIRNDCKLIDPYMKATPAEEKTITGVGAKYKITDTDGLWHLEPDPKFEDELADRLLKAEVKSVTGSDKTTNAVAVVYVLKAGEPMPTLRKHVEDRYRKLFDVKKWTELTDVPQGDSTAPASTAGVMRFTADSDNPNGSKCVVLKAIVVGDKVVGIEAYCDLKERDIWEKRLIRIAGSLGQ